MTTPLRPVSISSGARPTRIGARPPARSSVVAQPRAVEVGDHPGGDRSVTGIGVRPRRRGCRRATMPDRAGSLRAPRLRVRRCSAPRETSAIAPLERARRAASLRGVRVARRARRGCGRRASRRCRRSCRRRRASGRSVAHAPARASAGRAARTGSAAGAGAPAVSPSAPGAKTCVFETAATEIASGAVPGVPTEPRPKSSRSLPAEITGTTPAAATLSTASTQRVVRRVGLRAAAGEVDHVHAVARRPPRTRRRSRACRRRRRPASAR